MPIRRVPSILALLVAVVAVVTPKAGSAVAAAKVGFGVRAITPVGQPPAEWAQFFTPQPKTGVWGEPFKDLNEDGCMSGLTNHNLEPILDAEPPRGEAPEPHLDQPWNSAGDGYLNGAYSVRGVTIVGDPQSTGKWDGLWANAGFGSRCAEGMHDDTWARAMVLEAGGRTVALVSLDVVGLFNIEVRRATEEMQRRYPELSGVDLVVSSTHTHEGVDTMGYWGQLYLNTDGKFPAYQAFIRSQIIDAVHEAYTGREAAKVKFAKAWLDMGIRDSRPPQVKDPWLYAAQFVREDGSTIGTIVNWSNHPEAQGSPNGLISSDFPHGARTTLEEVLGGTAIYFSGSVGGLMTPLGVDIPDYGSAPSWARTFEIGRIVAETAINALAGQTPVVVTEMSVAKREWYMDVDNLALRALNTNGLFDIPTYVGAESWGLDGHRDGIYAGQLGNAARTEMVSIQFGPALFLTVPGELFPELELGGPGLAACAAANTGRPLEPAISQQFSHPYQFVLGLAQDELGYIVPGYDFWVNAVPQRDDGRGAINVGGLEATDPCGEGHYEETVSASSVMAPWVTCVAVELSGRDPWDEEHGHPACSYENTHVPPYGIDPLG